MKLNQAGIDLIKSFESLALEAYPDPGTGGDPWTIGYGHTKGVCEGDTCTEDQANQWLEDDLADAIQGVTDLVTIALNDNQFSALISFAFNCGVHNLKISTLLREINDSNFNHIVVNFEMWDKAAGKVMTGLFRRRAAEANLFMTEDT